MKLIKWMVIAAVLWIAFSGIRASALCINLYGDALVTEKEAFEIVDRYIEGISSEGDALTPANLVEVMQYAFDKQGINYKGLTYQELTYCGYALGVKTLYIGNKVTSNQVATLAYHISQMDSFNIMEEANQRFIGNIDASYIVLLHRLPYPIQAMIKDYQFSTSSLAIAERYTIPHGNNKIKGLCCVSDKLIIATTQHTFLHEIGHAIEYESDGVFNGEAYVKWDSQAYETYTYFNTENDNGAISSILISNTHEMFAEAFAMYMIEFYLGDTIEDIPVWDSGAALPMYVIVEQSISRFCG